MMWKHCDDVSVLLIITIALCFRPTNGWSASSCGCSRSRRSGIHYSRPPYRPRNGKSVIDEEDDYFEPDYRNGYRDDDRREYWSQQQEEAYDKPGAYNVRFSDYYDESQDEIKWELCDDGSTWVVHPPTHVDIPTAVIHFVGGTFFGSTPNMWYKTLLEEVVKATQCTVVATPIPVTLLKNPLRHVSLCRKLQRQFQSAYMNVLSDEYEPEVLTQVPIVGMGHSLGARLLTVLATLADKPSVMIPPHQAYILMSFNNFGASVSVPGIQSLLKRSKELEDGDDDDRPQRRKRRQRADYYDDFYDDEYEEVDDEEWEELMEELQDSLKEQAERVKNALTPNSDDLEFHPTPDQLWEALKTDKRYRIPKTLVVHFKDDKVDQSPRLADCLLQTNTSDVKYAFLKGNHLTPISADGELGWSQWLKFPARASKALSRWVRRGSRREPSGAMRDLRQSVARYITDVVTK